MMIGLPFVDAAGGPAVVVLAPRGLAGQLRSLLAKRRQLGAGDELRVAVALKTPDGALQRVWHLFWLRARIAGVERMIRLAGGTRPRRFAVLPSLDAPTFVYELRTAAGAYGAAHFRLGAAERHPVVRKIVEAIAGCDASTGAIVVVGTFA